MTTSAASRPRIRLLVAILAILALAALSALAMDSRSEAAGSKVVLGSKKFSPPNGKGFGRRTPRTIFNGGDPSGLVNRIHWKGWGHDVARGRGLGNQFKPGGGYYRRHVKVRLQARKLGHCGKHRAYTQLGARFQKRPGGHFGRWFLWSGATTICKSPF